MVADRLDCAMVRGLASSAIVGSIPGRVKPKTKRDISNFATKQASLSSKYKDILSSGPRRATCLFVGST